VYGTARLSPRTRAFLVSESLRLGVVRAAKNNGTSRRTVYRWRGRQGAYGDRSSRPHRSPRRTPDPVEASVLGLRLELRWGPDLIGPYLGLNPSTVHRILRRHGAHRLSHLFPQPRRSFGRFDISEPGELVAIDIKSLGRLDRGGGRRGPRHSQAGGTVGWRHLHVALDLASRLVYAELLPGKGNADTTAFVARALAFFDARGIRVRRGAHRQRLRIQTPFHERCQALGIRHTRTKPYHPWTNGRVERFNGTIQRECLYALEFHAEGERDLAVWLYPRLLQRRTPAHRTQGRLAA